MDIDLPDSHDAIEATAPVEQPAPTVETVLRHTAEGPISVDGISPVAPPTAESQPPHRPHRPQFPLTAAYVLQRMNQSKPKTTTPSATMPMPAPSQAPAQIQPKLEPPDDRSCSACNSASSSPFNPLVRCLRCSIYWHRLCYEPAIVDYTAASNKWTCRPCQEAASAASSARRLQARIAASTRSQGPILKIESPSFLQSAAVHKPAHAHAAVSWAHRSVDDRCAHVARMAPREMAFWLRKAAEQYPDFAMFPDDDGDGDGDDDNSYVKDEPTEPVSQEYVVRAPQYRNGIINSIRKSQVGGAAAYARRAPTLRAVPQRAAASAVVAPHMVRPLFEATPPDPDDDPTGLMDGWPRPGRGLYAALGPDWDVETAGLADSRDHASFSSIVYDEAGRKVRENGMPLLAV